MIGTGLFSLEKRKTWGGADLTCLCKCLMEGDVKQVEPVQVLLGSTQ